MRYMTISQKLLQMHWDYIIDCYFNGLREEISNSVNLRCPQSLNEAMAVTKVQESTYRALSNNG